MSAFSVNHRWTLTGLVLVASTAIALVAWQSIGTSPDSPPTTRASALWDRDYQSFAELLDSPGAVAVVGRVISVNPSYAIEGVPFTPAVIDVESVLAGSDRVGAESLTVVQTGGTIPGGRTVHIEDVQLLAIEDRVLLFLIPEPVSGYWAITGGPYGHFMIDNGEVRSATLNEMFDVESHPLVIAVQDRTLEEVSGEIEALEAAQPAR